MSLAFRRRKSVAGVGAGSSGITNVVSSAMSTSFCPDRASHQCSELADDSAEDEAFLTEQIGITRALVIAECGMPR